MITSDTSQPPVSVVLLAFNEAEVIETVVRDFHAKVVSRLPGSELIVAEDGSTDDTPAILQRLLKELPGLRLEQQKERRGYVNAFKTAMSYPRNDIIVFCDSSGKHDPEDFWKMYPLMADHELVMGYKVNRADPFYRLILARGFNFLVNTYFGVAFRDIDCPLRLFRRSAFQDIASQTWHERALVNFELTLRFHFRGYRIAQVPVTHRARQHGESRGLPLKKIPRVIANVLRNFSVLKRELMQPGYRRA
jgi:glycosyltransferase involved in cell wall biosynthesis